MSDQVDKKQFSAGVAAVEPAQEAEPQQQQQSTILSQQWTNLIKAIRAPVHRGILLLSDHAAAHPVAYIVGIVLISVLLVVTGLFTNFSVDVDEDTLWTPKNSRPLAHGEWIQSKQDSGFDKEPRSFLGLIHRTGDNVLGMDGVRRTFDAVDILRNTEGYKELCTASGNHEDFNGIPTCQVIGVTNFWNDTEMVFEDAVSTDDEAIVSMSTPTYPNGAPVDLKLIFGTPVVGPDGILESAEAYTFIINLPADDDDAAAEVEKKALDALLEMQDTWAAEEGNDFVLQVFADRSFSDEFQRAIVNDIPLVPIVFVIMSVFTCIVFWRRDWVFSRTLLGLGAVCTVFLAIMSGYGILFIAGVPFTSMTQILPFIMFGIGLDNAFIINGEFHRTNKTKTAVQRVHDTIDEVGLSIFLTTTTSVVAFALGTMSSVPAVFWLCQYAAPTIFINFLYQLTFFVALIVVDEQRVNDKRRDCLVCFTVKSRVGVVEDEDGPPQEESRIDRFMGWYADILFHPLVTTVVLLAFTGLVAGCAYSASKLNQEFQFTDVVPKDSYVADFWNDFTTYSERSGAAPGVYFRNVDQCDPVIQQQMEAYVSDLVEMKEVQDPPHTFWLLDFKEFVKNASNNTDELTCIEQITAFLEDPTNFDIYNKHIVRNTAGEITASRTFIRMNVDQDEVTEQVDALNNQNQVSGEQPVNENLKDWAFFTWDGNYYIWSFYAVAPQELIQTTIAGVVAVSVLGLIFIPHWTAVFFVAPMIAILYVDLLGVLQFAGVAVNAVSYVSLVMSIGLLVDFLMHVLLRYYESTHDTRKAKVKDTLQTMGASILVGAVSTFLGVIPLAFSSSEIFSTIFITFVGLVTLGAGHGLILLPVLLSLLGPTVCIKQENVNRPEEEEQMKPAKELVVEEEPVDESSEDRFVRDLLDDSGVSVHC